MEARQIKRYLTQADIPRQYRRLHDVVGMDALSALCATFGGITMYVPKAETEKIQARNLRIRAEKQAGARTCELSERYGISERRIQGIVSAGEGAGIGSQARSNRAAVMPESYRDLSEGIGEEATAKLCEAFGGRVLAIPREDALRKAARDQMIREDARAGVGTIDLSKRYGLPVSVISRILQKESGKGNGLSLKREGANDTVKTSEGRGAR